LNKHCFILAKAKELGNTYGTINKKALIIFDDNRAFGQ